MANYVRALGLAAIPRPPLMVWYPPAARRDKRRVRSTLQGLGCGCGVACALGDAAQAQSAVSYAALGAKAGSIVPGIGNIVGAVVGLVVGAVLAKKKPVRPTGQQVANCKTLLQQYSDAAAQSPNLPLPLDLSALKDLNWCMMAVYGNDVRLKDPRFFDGSYNDLLAIARNMVRAIFTTPVGGTVNIAETVQKIRGQTFRSSGLSFINPPFTNLKAFARDTFAPVAIAFCQQTAGKGAGGCPTLYNRSELSRWFFDVLGYVAATELPQVRAEDLNRPEPAPAPAPSTPAPTPQPTTAPPVAQPLPAPTSSLPVQPQLPLPPQALPAPVIVPPPIVQVQPAPYVPQPAPASGPQVQTAGSGGTVPLLLALAGGAFLLMRPAPRASRSRSRRR